jgi:hypothetical protein
VIRRLLLIAILAACAIAAPRISEGRPGGGDTYSSGGGGDSRRSSGGDRYSDDDGGSGGAGIELLIFVIRLCIRYPAVGVPLLLLVAGFVLFSAHNSPPSTELNISSAARSASPGDVQWGDWNNVSNVLYSTDSESDNRRGQQTAWADDVARVDPEFSSVLFEDFLFRLYAAAHGARGDRRSLDALAPYLSDAARTALARRPPTGEPVTAVVIGAMRVRDVRVPANPAVPGAVVRVRVEFEANYQVGRNPGSRRFAMEHWTLARAASARTRPPESSRRFPCPNCGAPWQTGDAAGTQKCASCGEVVDNGRFEWQVVNVRLQHERDNIPGLADEVPERGTSSATVRDPQFDARWNELRRDDPDLTEATVDARLRLVYETVNSAWTARNLEPARSVLSDGLADYLQYWLDAYAAQDLWNVLEQMRITRYELVRLRRDRHYDALTIRLWATGRDYVIRASDGFHVRGNRSADRDYSEYWTLIRGASQRGVPPRPGTCGSCGAPLTITMAGTCAHCGTHVTSGEFDWVLSKIEQDDAYRG